MALITEPETINFPESHYVFMEREGHIPTIAPQTWQAVGALGREILQHNRIVGAAALYKTKPGVYRAGFMLDAPPVNLPDGLTYASCAAVNTLASRLMAHTTSCPKLRVAPSKLSPKRRFLCATTSTSSTTSRTR